MPLIAAPHLALHELAKVIGDCSLPGIAAVQVNQRSPCTAVTIRSINSRSEAPAAAVSVLPV